MCAYVDYTAHYLTRQRKVRPGLGDSDYRVIPSGTERSEVKSRNLATPGGRRFLDSLRSLGMTW